MLLRLLQQQTQVMQISLANTTVLGCPATSCLNCLPKVAVALSKVLSSGRFITSIFTGSKCLQQLIEHTHIFTPSTPSIISQEACKEAVSHKEFMYMYPSLPDPPSLHARVWFRDYMFICECSCFLMVAMQSSQIITTQLPIVTITFGVAYKQFNLGEIDREKRHVLL